MKSEFIEHKTNRLLSEIRAAIVLVGGIEMPNEHLAKMTLAEFVDIAVRNGIKVSVMPEVSVGHFIR